MNLMKRAIDAVAASWMLGAVFAPFLAFANIMGDLPDATHAWAVHDPNRPRPPVVSVGATGVPSDAIVLFADAFIGALKDIGFDGYLSVEREAGNDRVGDIARAVEDLKKRGVEA